MEQGKSSVCYFLHVLSTKPTPAATSEHLVSALRSEREGEGSKGLFCVSDHGIILL